MVLTQIGAITQSACVSVSIAHHPGNSIHPRPRMHPVVRFAKLIFATENTPQCLFTWQSHTASWASIPFCKHFRRRGFSAGSITCHCCHDPLEHNRHQQFIQRQDMRPQRESSSFSLAKIWTDSIKYEWIVCALGSWHSTQQQLGCDLGGYIGH